MKDCFFKRWNINRKIAKRLEDGINDLKHNPSGNFEMLCAIELMGEEDDTIYKVPELLKGAKVWARYRAKKKRHTYEGRAKA